MTTGLVVLDTHAWIWFATESGDLSRAAERAVRRANRIGIHPISCWEVLRLVERGRLRLRMDAADWVRHAMARPGVEALPFTPTAAVRAVRFGEELGRDPADRFIVAAALEADAPLVTRDERIVNAGVVRTIW